MKLKGFTLLELLVGLVLSGIVVAASFTAYEVMAHRYGSYQQQQAAIRDAAWLAGVLGKDFERAEMISGNSEQLLLRGGGRRNLTYQFGTDFILRRDSLVTDTFHIRPANIGLRFNHEQVRSNRLPVDELVFTADIGSEPEQFVFHKNYPGDIRMAFVPQQEGN